MFNKHFLKNIYRTYYLLIVVSSDISFVLHESNDIILYRYIVYIHKYKYIFIERISLYYNKYWYNCEHGI